MKDIKKGENTSLTKNGSVAKAEVKKTVKAEGKTGKNGTKKPQSKKNVKKDNSSKAKKQREGHTNKTSSSKEQKKSLDLRSLGGLLLAKMFRGGAAELRSHDEEVNKLNVFPVPDGDTGDNMSLTIESGVRAIDDVDSDDIAVVMRMLSNGMLLGARGNSGVILSQFFAGVAKGFESAEQADPHLLGEALEMGVKQAYTTVMTPTEGTILTVAREAVHYAVSRINSKTTIPSFFNDLVTEMHASVDRTPDLLPALKEAGVVDSGGAGLFYIMDGFNRVLNGEDPEKDMLKTHPKVDSPIDISGFNADSEMVYGYCTEMLVQLQNSKTDPAAFDIEELKSFLVSVGDSVVAFMTGSIVKLHVHTLTPEAVIAHMRKYGEMLTVKIENMTLQHTEESAKAEGGQKASEPQSAFASFEQKSDTVEVEKKKYGIVAVSAGEGLTSIFTELGADRVISGGQTHNPSAGEFLEAYATLGAENIYVFPNNGNIMMAAEQSAELYKDARVMVVPSKGMGIGYAALSCFDPSVEDPDMLLDSLCKVCESVLYGYISPSIRDTCIGGIDIKEGDTIGIVGKEIVVASDSRIDAAKQLIENMLSDTDRYMLTVIIGEDATEEETALINEYLLEKHSDIEVYFLSGQQGVYPYLFVAE